MLINCLRESGSDMARLLRSCKSGYVKKPVFEIFLNLLMLLVGRLYF